MVKKQKLISYCELLLNLSPLIVSFSIMKWNSNEQNVKLISRMRHVFHSEAPLLAWSKGQKKHQAYPLLLTVQIQVFGRAVTIFSSVKRRKVQKNKQTKNINSLWFLSNPKIGELLRSEVSRQLLIPLESPWGRGRFFIWKCSSWPIFPLFINEYEKIKKHQAWTFEECKSEMKSSALWP